jgi:DNA/RNA-binding domain of Phe-tRNA-synthetase-like protein
LPFENNRFMNMTTVEISDEIRVLLPRLALGCVECEVKIELQNEALWVDIERICHQISGGLPLDEISKQPAIAASRSAYKRCGKDPARYRLSSEALMRRVVKGMELYRINNIVDLVNLVSLESGMSIGGYDADKIAGSAILSIGKEGEPYEAIGRGELNIAGLPVFRDNVSAFGSPTSDSVRTSVTNETCRFLMVIVGFIGQSETEKVMRRSVGLLQQYGFAAHIEQRIVV